MLEDMQYNTPGIRFVHSANGVPVVDVYNNNTMIAKNFGYGTESNYISFAPAMSVSLAVTSANSKDIALGPVKLNLDSSQMYTVIVVGTAGNMKTPLDAILLKDNGMMCTYAMI
jgi:hypothetical protein